MPVWFHEGWASLTAHGGGAEYATDAQAFAAIRAGRRVNLTVRDTPDQRHHAGASGLNIHEFYRESMLLVGWLKAQDETRFRDLVLAVQDNADFEIAFWDIYGRAPATRLAGFYGSVQTGTAFNDNGSTQAAPAQP
jgi:L-alanine-DL-glutamate epimerase-like enolase superfamily enzyme